MLVGRFEIFLCLHHSCNITHFSMYIDDQFMTAVCFCAVDLISQLLIDKPKGVTITTSADQDTAIEGQDVTLTCQVSDAKPAVSEYRFYYNDSILGTASNNKYTIYDVKRSEQYGKYKCVARNDAGDKESSTVFLNINGKSLIFKALSHYKH